MSAVWETRSDGPAKTFAKSGVRVWDRSIRLTHWSLVVLVALSWWTASHQQMSYHRYTGYALLGVLAYRIYWGVFGSSTARFAHFVKGPHSILQYLRSDRLHAVPGHNPLGAVSVVALLGLLLGQVTLGLFSVDVDGLESGPLSRWVSFETGRACARLHQRGFDVLKTLILLHVAAIVFYLIVRRDNLLRPMITGVKGWNDGSLPHVEPAPRWHAVVGIALAVLLVWYIA